MTTPDHPRKLPPWAASALVFALAMAVLVPTTGDIGLTWDEPSYRYSQVMSAQWWGRLLRNPVDPGLFTADALLYYWPYGRFGINFHPPLAGQLDLLTYELFGGFMKDIPARRMASVIEFALTLTVLYHFLARRYNAWVGGVAASALLLMPRVYGDAHIAGTDTPGLLLWAVTAFAFWNGLHEPKGRRWRVAVGVLVGLAFVEKMGAVMVVLPIVLWLMFARMPRLFRKGSRADWLDGLLTSTAMLVPLGLAYREIVRLSGEFDRLLHATGRRQEISQVDLFSDHPAAFLPGWILAVPLVVWIVRRLLARALPKSRLWGAERPGLETWTAMLGFGPVVAWLGNPAWWRETLPRLAHYYALNTGRRGALPDIKILYFGQTYEYSLPWHNAWVLIAITVPASILIAAIAGLVLRICVRGAGGGPGDWLRSSAIGACPPSWDAGPRPPATAKEAAAAKGTGTDRGRSEPVPDGAPVRRDRVPLYFLLHLLMLPVLRMGPTPAHDGVRLFLPTFFFLAAFAGWGTVGLADLAKRSRTVARSVLSALVLLPAAWGLMRIHPFELSYYNELIGGPRGAWNRGFELSYWYEAFDRRTLDDLNRTLPDGALLDGLNKLTEPPTFACLQELGYIKETIVLGSPSATQFPYLWILTHDSKAVGLTRLAFAMTPFYERRPRQLGGLRVVTVDDPKTVARAWALQLLADDDPIPPTDPPSAPAWVRSALPPLARFWGDGVTKAGRLRVNERAFAWARADPEGLRAAARVIADGGPIPDGSDADRLRTLLTHGGARVWTFNYQALLRTDPKALPDAVAILIARPDAVRTVLTRYPYTDPESVGGPLDSNLTGRKD